jgi:hypothetical protein
MSSVTTKTSPFKDIPSGAFAKWRNFSEQRASYAGKKELTQGPTPFDRKFDLTPGSPSEPHEFLGKLRWLARFLPQDKAAAPKKQAPTTGGKRGDCATKSPVKAGLIKFCGVPCVKWVTAVNASFVKTAGISVRAS